MLCSIVYEKTNKELIEVQDVDCSIPYFYKALDSGFFKVRYERCSLADKKIYFLQWLSVENCLAQYLI